MTNHVPTLETCQKLKEAGFPQNTYMQFREDGALIESMHHPSSAFFWFAAPILTEIWNESHSLDDKNFFFFEQQLQAIIQGSLHGANLADQAAILWLKLHP